MLLNSVNKSNFNFLFLEKEKNNKTNKKKKKNINLSILLSSSMVNKFNNKTSWILDNPFQNNKLSKNIGDFRKQIINSYKNLDRNMESAFLSKKIYQNALDIFDEAEDLKIQKNLKNEEEFYKLKSNEIGLYSISLKKEEENNKENIKKFNSFKNIKSLYFNFGKNKDDVSNLQNNNAFSSKNISLNFKLNSFKNILNNTPDNIKNINKNSKNKNNNLLKAKNGKSLECINNYTDKNMKFKENIDINKNYNSKNRLNNSKIKEEEEKMMRKALRKFWRFQKKKILDKSKRLANSMSQMNFFHYKPKGYADYKNATLNINSENLTRLIKLMRINKYLCDVEDDDLLVMDSKKLRALMKEAEIQYYLINKKDFQLSYLRKNLRPQTISKFYEIKNSYFGLPC